jgi:hypothetical protein
MISVSRTPPCAGQPGTSTGRSGIRPAELQGRKTSTFLMRDDFADRQTSDRRRGSE